VKIPPPLQSAAIAFAFVAGLLTAPVSAQPAAGAPDTLAKIRAAKQMTVAFSGDSPPFSSVGAKDQPAGYSIDLCKRVIAQLGRAVGIPDLKVNWRVGTVAERLEMVKSGKAELDCANTTATLTRMRDVDFSSLVFLDSGGFLVKGGSPIQKFADLAGKNIGVLGGTTTETRLNAMLKQRLVNAKVTPLKDGNEGVAMLQSGSLDAFAGDRLKLFALSEQAKAPNALVLLNEDLSLEPYAFALPRNDSAYRLEVNKALTQIYIGGDIDAIFQQWLGPFGRPSGLLAAMYLLNSIPQ
jgi:glutamate/aspartate transport system substrate-binding protein